MKDIIDNFVKAHKDFKLYISYGRMDDIGLDCKTINTETYMISTIDRDFEFRANNEFNKEIIEMALEHGLFKVFELGFSTFEINHALYVLERNNHL